MHMFIEANRKFIIYKVAKKILIYKKIPSTSLLVNVSNVYNNYVSVSQLKLLSVWVF